MCPDTSAPGPAREFIETFTTRDHARPLKRLELAMNRTLSAGLLAAAIVGLGFGVAEAHPKLLSANPTPNARVAAPAEVRLGLAKP